MPFQNTVNWDMASGVPGEIAFDGPTRAEPGILNSADAANNVFGRVFSESPAAPGVWRAGYTDAALDARFAIMISPKEHVSYGTAAGGTLAPTLTLPNGVIATFLTMGEVWAISAVAADIGDVLIFNNTTGVLTAQPAATAVPGGSTLLPSARVSRNPGNANGVCTVRITQ